MFTQLGEQERASLLLFAEFLLTKANESGVDRDDSGIAAEPEFIVRPEKESVVAAIRRLTKTYFMLEKSSVLHEASSLMGAHVMQGRPANEVIDDLETLFRKAYGRYLEQLKD